MILCSQVGNLCSRIRMIAITLQQPHHLSVSAFYMCVYLCNLPFPYHVISIFEVVPVKASFVEYIVQDCPEGVTERGTCQRLTLESDTEVLNTERENYLDIINIPYQTSNLSYLRIHTKPGVAYYSNLDLDTSKCFF